MLDKAIGFFKVSSLRLVGLALGFVAHFFIAQKIGPEGYGYFALVILFSWYISGLISSGVSLDVLRKSVVLEKKEAVILYHSAKAFIQKKVVLFIVLAALILILGKWFSYNPLMLIGFGTLGAILVSLKNLRVDALRGLGLVEYAALPEQIVRPVLLIIFALIPFGFSNYLYDAVLLFYASLIGTYLVGNFIFHLLVENHNSGNVEENELPSLPRKNWTLQSCAFMLDLIFSIELIVLGFIASPYELGIYAACHRIASIPITIVDSAVPLAYRDIHRNKGMSEIIKWSAMFAFLGMIILTILFLNKELILTAFGPDFVEGVPLLVVLFLSRGLVLPFLLSKGLILIRNKESAGLKIAIVSLVCLIIATVFGWHLNQSLGVAMCSGAVLVLTAGIMFLIANGKASFIR